MKFAAITDPDARVDTPHAVQVDLHILFLVGTALWTVASIIYTVLWSLHIATLTDVIICVWGIALGVMGLIWETANRHGYRLVALMQQ